MDFYDDNIMTFVRRREKLGECSWDTFFKKHFQEA